MLPKGLKEGSHRYSLFAALKELEQTGIAELPLGTTSRRRSEPLQVCQLAHVTFAPSDVKRVALTEDGRLKVEQYSFGLMGPNGALPLHVSQTALGRTLAKDDGMVAFLDVFHHRLATLFYRAWADSEPTVGSDRPATDPVAIQLASLAGIGTQGVRGRDSLADTAKARAAAPLAAAARSVEGLQLLLTQHFDSRVEILPFRGEWLDIPMEEQCRIGALRTASRLGSGAMLGRSTWQCSHRFEIRIGPIDRDTFNRFRPGSPAQREIAEWVRLYTHDEWAWSVRLLVRQSVCDGVHLGNGGQIGWDAWLGNRKTTGDEVVLQGDQLTMGSKDWRERGTE